MKSAKDIATRLRAEFAAPDESIDLRPVARALGCEIQAPGPIGTSKVIEAELRPHTQADRFSLHVDPIPRYRWDELPATRREAIARHRLRFRVGHELGHTFFYERRPGYGPRRVRRWSSAEERWCDEFARELLLPGDTIRSAHLSASLPFELQRRFDVSLEVAVRAVAVRAGGKELALWYWQAGDRDEPSSLLRQWSNSTARSLRPWRESPVVAEAMREGGSRGSVPQLGTRGLLPASTHCDSARRQLVLIAGS